MIKRANIFNKWNNLTIYHLYIITLEVYIINIKENLIQHYQTFKKQLEYIKMNKTMMKIQRKKVKIKQKKYVQMFAYNNVMIKKYFNLKMIINKKE